MTNLPTREIKFKQEDNGKWHYWGFLEDGFVGPLSNAGAGESHQYTGLKDKQGKEIYEGDILSFSAVSGWGIVDTLTTPGVEGTTGEVVNEDTASSLRSMTGVVSYSESWGKVFVTSLQEPTAYPFEKRGDGRLVPWETEVIGNIYENPELLK